MPLIQQEEDHLEEEEEEEHLEEEEEHLEEEERMCGVMASPHPIGWGHWHPRARGLVRCDLARLATVTRLGIIFVF